MIEDLEQNKHSQPQSNCHHRFEAPQITVRTPVLGHFDAGTGELAIVAFKLFFKSFKKYAASGMVA